MDILVNSQKVSNSFTSKSNLRQFLLSPWKYNVKGNVKMYQVLED